MKITLEKWLLFLGVLLFCLLAVPELEAMAADFSLYDISIPVGDETRYLTVEYIDGTATVSFTGFEPLSLSIPSRYSHFYVFRDYDNERLFVYFTSVAYYVEDQTYTTKKYGFPCLALSAVKYFEFCYSGTNAGYSYANPGDFNGAHKICTSESGISSALSSMMYYSNSDIYYGDTLVFQRPLPSPTPTPSLQQQFQTAVEMTNLEAVMTQVVGLAPLLIGLLITLFGFSKGLGLLSETLRKV